MATDLYFSLEKTVYVSDRRVKLSEFCTVLGANARALDSVVFNLDGDALAISALEVTRKLTELYPGYTVTSLGSEECGIFLKHKKQSPLTKAAKAVLLCIVMFFGGAVAIMTFHEDVNMRGVHTSIYAFFNGGVQAESLIVSIPYTLGISLGFITLFGFFTRRKKRATVLDIDIHEHEKMLRDYLSAKSKQPDG